MEVVAIERFPSTLCVNISGLQFARWIRGVLHKNTTSDRVTGYKRLLGKLVRVSWMSADVSMDA